MRLPLYVLSLITIFLVPGCAWFQDSRPEPDGSPYATASCPPKQSYTEAEAVNAAVSAVSLKMAVSRQGPFRVIPKKDRTTSLGSRTIDSLTRMGLSRLQAPYPLYLEDRLDCKRQWTVTLIDASGKTFYRKTFLLRGK